MQREFPDADGLPVLGVSELVELAARDACATTFGEVRVEGEIASLFRSRPGHLYFDLKDERALIRAVMFRSAGSSAAARRFEPQDGMLVQARGRLDVYAERGSLQLIAARRSRPCGEGALRVAFERCKRELAAEGLFDAEHKRRCRSCRAGSASSPRSRAR